MVTSRDEGVRKQSQGVLWGDESKQRWIWRKGSHDPPPRLTCGLGEMRKLRTSCEHGVARFTHLLGLLPRAVMFFWFDGKPQIPACSSISRPQ